MSAIRFLVGGLFVYAGLAKIMDPHSFLKSIESFRLLPIALVGPMAIVLPPLEFERKSKFSSRRSPLGEDCHKHGGSFYRPPPALHPMK